MPISLRTELTAARAVAPSAKIAIAMAAHGVRRRRLYSGALDGFWLASIHRARQQWSPLTRVAIYRLERGRGHIGATLGWCFVAAFQCIVS